MFDKKFRQAVSPAVLDVHLSNQLGKILEASTRAVTVYVQRSLCMCSTLC